MELYTLTRNMKPNVVVDKFASVIWTERYYGDADFELVVPNSDLMTEALVPGTFLGLEGSTDIMIIESRSFEGGMIKLAGIGLLPWFNNRYIRTSTSHKEQYLNLESMSVGKILWWVIRQFSWDGWWNQGYGLHGPASYLPFSSMTMIPGLTLKEYDDSGSKISIAVPFGPAFDAMRDIAVTYEMGMQLLLEWTTGHPEFDTNPPAPGYFYPDPDPPRADYYLGFRAWKGQDRTGAQTDYPVVRFSPETESLANLKELQSVAKMCTAAYVYCPSDPNSVTSSPSLGDLNPGISNLGRGYGGFDCRVIVANADDITTDQIGTSRTKMTALLDARAKQVLGTNVFIQAVDGQVVKDITYKYGKDYNLGDVVEVEGISGAVTRARVTEFIRSQDSAGAKEYPTLAALTS